MTKSLFGSRSLPEKPIVMFVLKGRDEALSDG